MRNILAENERQNNARGSGISVSASSSGPRYSRSQSRYNVDLRQGLVDDSYLPRYDDTNLPSKQLIVSTIWTGRRISHPDNSPSRRTQSWSYQISGDSLEQIARERLAAGNTTGSTTGNAIGNTSEATTSRPLASISNNTNGGRTVHHSIHVPERSFPGKVYSKLIKENHFKANVEDIFRSAIIFS